MSEEIERPLDEVAETIEAEAPAVEEVETEQVEAEGETAAPEEAEPQPKRRNRAEERINALTREKYEAQQEAQRLKAQFEQMQQDQLRRQLQDTGDLPMPTLADVGYDEAAYQHAVQQWSEAKTQKQYEQAAKIQQQRQAEQQAQQQQAVIAQKMQEGMVKYPDFQQRVGQMPSLGSINQAAYAAMMESDQTADVAYYLASNPQEAYALASMTPIQAIRKVAEIEGRLAAKPAPTNLPPKPPSKLGGQSNAVTDPTKMSTAEFMKWREAQLSKR